MFSCRRILLSNDWPQSTTSGPYLYVPSITADYRQTSQSKSTGSTINWWPILLDHYKADMAVNFIAKLYAAEKQTKHTDAATRYRVRQQTSVPVLKQFHTELLKSQQQVPPKTALGKAINYTLEYWLELSKYCENGAWPIDNNPVENAIRGFVIGRKNWLFSHSQRGARASADLYSLIETGKANGKEPYSYLSWLFEKLPGADPQNIESLMPWNMLE